MLHYVTMLTDETFMTRALELAEQGRFSVSPNPMVGAVIVRDGMIVAEGFHERAGEPHAEIVALAKGADVRGATMYVTLEPCSHEGRTGPCAPAIVAAGIKRVVVAAQDPNPKVNGKGIQILREGGIDVISDVLADQTRKLNEFFIHSQAMGRPFVVLKAGMTLDGKLATVSRESKWITCEASRERSLRLREEYDAVLVGSGTVRQDNPHLTRRLGLNRSINPWTRVIVDGAGGIPASSHVLSDGGRTLLFTSTTDRYQPGNGLEIILAQAGENGRIDLGKMLATLFEREIRSVLVEGGSLLHSEMIRSGLWQKMILFVAPMFLGGSDAPSIFQDEGSARLTEARRFRFDAIDRIGTDLMITAYRL